MAGIAGMLHRRAKAEELGCGEPFALADQLCGKDPNMFGDIILSELFMSGRAFVTESS